MASSKKDSRAHAVLVLMGSIVTIGFSTRTAFVWCVGKAWRCDVYSVCHVVFQTNGATPLLVASLSGHVECVRALLGAGAAVNQATVCCARSMARCYGGTVCGDVWEPALMQV